jgi:hypothetical protein
MKYILGAVVNLLYWLIFAVVYIVLLLWDLRFRDNISKSHAILDPINEVYLLDILLFLLMMSPFWLMLWFMYVVFNYVK